MSDILPRDENNALVLGGTSNLDGSSIVEIYADPATKRLFTQSTITDGTNTATVNSDGQLHVVRDGSVVDSNNSTSSTLGIDAVFTGTGTDILGYNNVTIQLFADQDSATSGISFEFSIDNSNWDEKHTFTLTASESRKFQFPCHARYFRLVYTNGGTGQGAFRVQTILHQSAILTTIHRLGDDVGVDRSAQLVKSILTAQKAGTGDFTPIDSTTGGNLKVSLEELESGISVNSNTQLRTTRYDSSGKEIVTQVTAFGEQSVAEPTPVVQVQFPYNINTDIWETRNNNGSSSVSNNMANLSTGAAANQSSTIITRNFLKYNPGQGALVRFTALYTTGVANNTQWVGIGDTDDGFFFGYNGATFGVLRRQGGKPETRRLAITTASNTEENITITLDGDAESVAVTAAGADSATTRVVTANEIVAHDFSNVGEGWEVHNMGPNIFFTSFSDGSKTGTYSLVNGGGEAAGTFTQSLAGVSATDTVVAQSAWSEDTLDGSSVMPDGLFASLDPTKGNVYQIRYQWLGFGSVEFYVEHGAEGDLHLVHRIEYANDNTVPSIDNPTLPLCIATKNTTNTSDVVVKVGSMGGFVEGRDVLPGLPHSLSIESTSISTTETPVLTIHSHDIYQSTLNRVKIKMTSGSVSTDGTKNSIIRIRKNTVLAGPVSFTPLDSNISTIHRDTTATGVSGGVVVFAEGAEKVGFVDIDLEKLGITLVAPDFLTVTIQATAAATVDVIATLNWQEQF